MRALLIAALMTSHAAFAAEPAPPLPAATQPAANFSDPINTYRTYLEAVKRDDLAAAKACYVMQDKNDDAGVDMAIGLWFAHHRFQKQVRAKFGNQEDSPYWRPDCTDEAIDRTIARLSTSKFEIKGERAELKIDWAKNDDEVFCHTGDNPIALRKQGDLWKIASNLAEKGVHITQPGTWGWAFLESTKLLNEASNDIESGKLKSWDQVSTLLAERTKALEHQYSKDHQDPSPKMERPHSAR